MSFVSKKVQLCLGKISLTSENSLTSIKMYIYPFWKLDEMYPSYWCLEEFSKKIVLLSVKTNAFNFRHHICWAYLNFSKNLEPFSEKSHLRQEWLTGLSFTDSIKRNCPGYNVRMYWTDFWQPNNKIFLKKFF